MNQRLRGGIGSGMFDEAISGCVFVVVILLVLAFVAGILVNGCCNRFGHPSLSWTNESRRGK